MLNLLSIFLYIGSVSFGGGWAVVGLIKDIMISQNYLTFTEFKEILTAAQITPGPIAVNMATYIGYKYHGFIGAILTTFFLLLPPIIIIASYLMLKKSIKLKKEYFINSLALGTAVLVFITLYSLGAQFLINFDIKAIILVLVIFILLVKTKIDPLFFIIGSGLIAILVLWSLVVASHITDKYPYNDRKRWQIEKLSTMSVNMDWIALKWANINKFEPQNETDMLYSVDKQDTIGETSQD